MKSGGFAFGSRRFRAAVSACAVAAALTFASAPGPLPVADAPAPSASPVRTVPSTAAAHARPAKPSGGRSSAVPYRPVGPGSEANARPKAINAVVATEILPSAPAAAHRTRTTLPVPDGWPFPEAFPGTAGTGRMTGGAMFWTDFIYDDRGARSHPVRKPATPLAWPRGTYEYESPDAANNGADIFRAAVGLDDDASYWRVDWNTLINPRVPIAVFALDTDADTATGSDQWPASAGIRSPGIDASLIVSAAGARLVDAAGNVTALAAPAKDADARSFVLRVPRATLPVAGTWRVRLAAGVADAGGLRFAPVPPSHGGRGGGVAVYNVAFRSAQQERPVMGFPKSTATMNYWMEHAQATALSDGDVSAFFADIVWSDLAARAATPEPLPPGWSVRWYVSSIEMGQGIVEDAREPQDGRPNYPGRVQPYAIYVPTGYHPARASSLTWLLHSAFQPHTAFAVMTPAFADAACEQRNSICVSPLGRGHDGWFFDEAELDFWEVWRSVAGAYTLDPHRTVIGGFSMGGYGAYRLGLSYPELFAGIVAIGATQICGERHAPGVERNMHPGRCTTDADTTPLLENARHLPVLVAHGTADELLPFSGAVLQVSELDRLGFRYRFEHAAGQPHIPWYMQDAWFSAAESIGDPVRTSDPARMTLRWYPNAGRSDLGTDVHAAWWLTDLRAARIEPGLTARVDAFSAALDEPASTPRRATYPVVRSDSTPLIVSELTWPAGTVAASGKHVDLTFENVATATADLSRAGFGPDDGATLSVTTDSTLRLTITGLSASRVIVLAPGIHTIVLP